MHRWDPLLPVAEDDLAPFGPAERSLTPARALAELGMLVAVAIVLTLVVKALVAQAFFIPSGSMEPQLVEGDRVVVSRLAYRLHDPRRGDLIVFDAPSAPPDQRSLPRRVLDDVLETVALKAPEETELIKRVVGLPGERIDARGGVVHVDDRPVVEPYLPDGVTTADFGPVDIPAGHVFVLGDNRGNSQDSRSSVVGPVPVDRIIGRALARVWPPSRLAYL